MANNLLMLGLSYFRRKLFEFQAFHNQAHIVNFTGIIIYFCGTYYLYAQNGWVDIWVMRFHFRASIKPIMFLEPLGALFTLLKGQKTKTAGRLLFMGL